MLEPMGAFFDARLDIYDEHQRTCIAYAEDFLRFTASLLPLKPGCRLLDLGCGTGLELEYFFPLNPSACVTGIDLAPGMLGELRRKFTDKDVHLVQGSYFEVPFGEKCFEAAVSVESLHHFTMEEKIPLYTKLHQALTDGGYFVLTDYFSASDEEERALRAEYLHLKQEENLPTGTFYHFDTPLTPLHEIECLHRAGFETVEILQSWGQTLTIKAE